MPQIVRTTNDVIVNSLYLLGELGIGESPDSFMLSTGLDLINELLDKFAVDSIYIPYLTTIRSKFIVGKGTYSISDMEIADITQDRIVDLSFANYEVPSGSASRNQNLPVSFPFTADVTTNLLTVSTTSFMPTGTPVTISSTGHIPLPLVLGVTYYAITLSPTTLKLALSMGDANNGIFIVLQTDGIPFNVLTVNSSVLQPADTRLIYPLRIISKAQYYNVVRQNNLLSRPGFIFLDKQAQESLITVYPKPDQPYPFEIQVKCMLNNLVAQQSLGELPPNYYGFLKYALADKFMGYYPSGNWTPRMQQELDDYYTAFKNANETDFTIRPSVILTAPEPFYWPNILSY